MSGRDFSIRHEGTFAYVRPLTRRCRRWLQRHTCTEPWQWHRGKGLVVDHRMLDELVDALQARPS